MLMKVQIFMPIYVNMEVLMKQNQEKISLISLSNPKNYL
jgi:hypothetical protein